MDLWPRCRAAQARKREHRRPLGHAVLPARLRLRRRHALPLDHERLLADGRHRVRYRQAPSRPRGRQHPGCGSSDVPQPVGAHPQEDAQEGARQGQEPRSPEPTDPAPDSSRRALRPLREDLRRMAEARRERPALFDRRLQQHVGVEARLRLHLWLRSRRRQRCLATRRRPAGALPQLRRARQPPPAPEHDPHRQRAARIGRVARQEVPRHGRRRDRAVPPRDRGAHRATSAPPTTSATPTCCAK